MTQGIDRGVMGLMIAKQCTEWGPYRGDPKLRALLSDCTTASEVLELDISKKDKVQIVLILLPDKQRRKFQADTLRRHITRDREAGRPILPQTEATLTWIEKGTADATQADTTAGEAWAEAMCAWAAAGDAGGAAERAEQVECLRRLVAELND